MIDELYQMIRPEHRLFHTKNILAYVFDLVDCTSEYYLTDKNSRAQVMDKIIEILKHERDQIKKDEHQC